VGRTPPAHHPPPAPLLATVDPESRGHATVAKSNGLRTSWSGSGPGACWPADSATALGRASFARKAGWKLVPLEASARGLILD